MDHTHTISRNCQGNCVGFFLKVESYQINSSPRPALYTITATNEIFVKQLCNIMGFGCSIPRDQSVRTSIRHHGCRPSSISNSRPGCEASSHGEGTPNLWIVKISVDFTASVRVGLLSSGRTELIWNEPATTRPRTTCKKGMRHVSNTVPRIPNVRRGDVV